MMPVRYRVVAFTLTLAALTYLDRVCIATLAPNIMQELGLSRTQMSYVFSAFTLSYALFEVPTAWWADRIGSRKVLTRIVGWWSVFTILTATAWNLPSLIGLRFLFGVGEAGAWPNAARVFSRWIPARERGTVQGVFFAAAHLMGGLTPLLVAWMATFLPWRTVFVVFGLVGFVWMAAWWTWFRDEPRDHPQVSSQERQLIEQGRNLGSAAHLSFGQSVGLLRLPQVFALCLMYTANTYGFYFLITWLPQYLSEGIGMPKSQLSLYAGMPLLFSVVADLLGGVTTDRLSARYGVRWGRRIVGASGYLLAALLLLASLSIAHVQTAAVLLALAAAFSMFTLAPSWAACIEIGGSAAGSVSALMNTFGQIGGFFSPLILAWLVEDYNNWSLPIYVMAGMYAMAFLCWLYIDASQRVVADSPAKPELAVQ